jgi:hypothetical protein
MTTLSKTTLSKNHRSSLGISELVVAVTVVFLLIAVQGMYVAKHPVTLNAAATAELAPFGIAGP